MIYVIFCLFNRGLPSTFSFPAADLILLLADPTPFGIELRADFALTTRRVWVCVHDQFHAASLPRSVLFGAVGAKGTPLVVAAVELVLVVVAHFVM